MAFGTDINFYFRLACADCKRVAAGTRYFGVFVPNWMDRSFHEGILHYFPEFAQWVVVDTVFGDKNTGKYEQCTD